MEKIKATLLLCDDEQILAHAVKQILEDVADKILVSYNGVTCLEMIETEKVDCVICDINMPKMNGVQVLRTLREKDINIPFIFYSGHGGEHLMAQALKYGAFDFIHKPELSDLESVARKGLEAGLKLKAGNNQELREILEDEGQNEFIKEYCQMLKDSKVF